MDKTTNKHFFTKNDFISSIIKYGIEGVTIFAQDTDLIIVEDLVFLRVSKTELVQIIDNL